MIILMTALLEELGVKHRQVWAFDSFQGLPKPNSNKYPADKGNQLHKINLLSSDLQEVIRNFERYDLSTGQVEFVEGWFSDTLPDNDVKKIAVLRLDGDLYESSILALEHLYSKISVGGYVIIDDYNAFDFCKKAVDDFRKAQGINHRIVEIDKEAVYWQILE